MLSIFDIPTKKEDLSSINQGIADLRYDEVQSLRNLTDDTTNSRFAGQEITYRWDYANGKWWIPSRSYFRIRCKLTKADGVTPLALSDEKAPNMGMADAMIQQCQLKIADKTVEDISNFYPQVASLKTRLSKTAQWMRTTGNNLNYWESSREKRKQHVCVDGHLENDRLSLKTHAPEIKSRKQLGIPDACTLALAVPAAAEATIITFAAGNGDEALKFNEGDWIVIVEAGTGRLLPLMMVGRRSELIMICVGMAVPAAAIGAATVNFYRVRYSPLSGQRQLDDAGLQGQALVNVAGSAIGMDRIQALIPTGDLLFHGGNAASPSLALAVCSILGRGAYNAGANNVEHQRALHGNVTSAIAANAYIEVRHHSEVNYYTATELGFPAEARIGLNQTAVGQPVYMTFTVNDSTQQLIPNLREIFKSGDWILWNETANAGRNLACMVWDIDDTPTDASSARKNVHFQRVKVATLLNGGNIDFEDNAGAGNLGENQGVFWGKVNWGGPVQYTSEDNEASKVSEFELIWKPALSMFDIPHAIPGGGKFEIVIVPFADTIYQSKAIETTREGIVHRTDYQLQIQDMRLYNAVCEGPMTQASQYILDLQETRCQNIPLTTASRVQYSIDISPSINAVTIAFQDQGAVQLPQYSNTRFKVRNDLELTLEEFYVRISQLQRPQPNADLLYLDYRGQDFYKEVYARNLFYNGQFYDSSAETLKEWRDRGFYLHYAIPRTGTDRSTRCNISTKFREIANQTTANVANILLFHHYKKVAIVQMDQGRITAIRISNA